MGASGVNANETKRQTSGQFNAYLHLTAAGRERGRRSGENANYKKRKLESSVGLGMKRAN